MNISFSASAGNKPAEGFFCGWPAVMGRISNVKCSCLLDACAPFSSMSF